MQEKVLVYSRFPKALMQRIGERFDLLDAAGKPPHDVFPADQLSGIRAMITAGGTPLRGDMMDKLPSLGAIVCYGTGYDGVDLEAAAQRKIAVGHSPGANASSVADIAVILMLTATRRLLVADNYVRSGDWGAAKPSPMMRPQAGMPGLMIAVRAGADTHHVVNADILKKLGEGGHVVNIARGSVIDQDALVKALADKTIAGAGLDVYAKEPHAPDALTAFPNVVLTPHIGGHTLESHTAMQDCVIANLEAFFAGQPLAYAVR